MKILRRSFGERFALLELENGDYYHLPIDSKYIPSEGDELKFDHFDLGAEVRPVHGIEHFCGHCRQFHVEMYYLKIDTHTLKEL